MIATHEATKFTAPLHILYAMEGDLQALVIALTDKPDLHEKFAGMTAREWAEKNHHTKIAKLLAWAEENEALGL
jgi:hypothetical protein